MTSNYFWSALQKAALQNAYQSGGLSLAQQVLSEKPKGAIATQACRMKLTTPKPRKPKT
jgi:hypothetical protein